MNIQPLLVFSTFPDLEQARRIVRTLVEERVIACGNLIPSVESIYRWEGKVETAAEVQAVMKTTTDRWWKLEARLRELHPYEVPEIVSVKISDGLPAYLRWLDESCLES